MEKPSSIVPESHVDRCEGCPAYLQFFGLRIHHCLVQIAKNGDYTAQLASWKLTEKIHEHPNEQTIPNTNCPRKFTSLR